MASHAPLPEKSSAVLAAWAVLVGMGGTSVTYQIWHAVHTANARLPLALLFAVTPVFVAMCLSHIAAVHRSGWLAKSVTVAVMLAAMVLSAGAIASVVAPMAMGLSWLFGGVLDAAALLALAVILTERQREAARQAARAAEAERETGAVASAVAERDEARDAAHEAREAARAAQAEALESAGTVTRLEAELVTVRAELAAERERASARNPRRTSGRKPARKPAATSARNQGGPSGAEADLDKEALALRILAAHPGISGSELGRRVGASDRYGRDLLRRLPVPVNGNGAQPS